MSRVNILKQIKFEGRWKMVSIPRDSHGKLQWKSLPEGRYYIEWHEQGKRKREAGGATVADALETARRRKHVLEHRALGLRGFAAEDEALEKTALHVAVRRYLDVVENLKKLNTFRKYEAVLDRFLKFLVHKTTVKSVTPDDLNNFMVHLKKKHRVGNATVVHNMVIVAQFMKKQGRPGLTRAVELPEALRSLPKEYSDDELRAFFGACTPYERTLFTTFLLTGFREMEVVHLTWDDVNFNLNTLKTTAKPDLGFSPKRSEEREVPVPKQLMDLIRDHPRRERCRFVFPSSAGNREHHMLEKCKEVARRAKVEPERFNLKTFRSTYATRMLRAGFDVRTVQHWLGHRSLETTMRYLAPARNVHEQLDQVKIAGVLGSL
ncbi:MAG: tyrosine-type recombinase/integrase [Bryobacteraceae bacterium]